MIGVHTPEFTFEKDLANVRRYIGSERGERHVDAAPDRLRLNEWTLTGDWSVGKGSCGPESG